MFKHIKLLQSGSDRYHGLHKRVKTESCQCRTVGEVTGPVLKGGRGTRPKIVSYTIFVEG